MDMTMKELRQHPLYKEIKGRSSMRKLELVDAMKKFMRRDVLSKKCKNMEKKCPMSTTLLGEEWCEVDEKDLFHTDDYRMCFEFSELLRMTHEGFVASDTSYRPPLARFKLPRDANRQMIPKAVFKNFLLKGKVFERHFKYIDENHELLYFFVHIDDFYKTFDKPRYKSPDMNPVVLSRELQKWFEKYKEPMGGLRLIISNDKIRWETRSLDYYLWNVKKGKFSVKRRD
jgi:hypothetical protein